ncbi:MAG TPA: hypothetical protein DCP90_03175 [Clostridiales bacterium]|nr:MAG: hypothetical protein A2Y22_05970 [Clostridiales bacterium GWD2_32_59]HAN09597.1 hypothetical protein [Clostridiales bacterium]
MENQNGNKATSVIEEDVEIKIDEGDFRKFTSKQNECTDEGEGGEVEIDYTNVLHGMGIEVQVRKNIDMKEKEDNIDVKIVDNSMHDSRKLSLNGAVQSLRYVKEMLLNMGIFEKIDDIAEKIRCTVKSRMKNKIYYLMHETFGWTSVGGKEAFKLFDIQEKRSVTKSEYVAKPKVEIEKLGSLDSYIEGIKRLIIGKPKREICFTLGVYGILLQALKLNDANIIINFYGKVSENDSGSTSGLGKTTCTKAALIGYGNAHKLIKTYKNTKNKIDIDLLSYQIIPLVLDDVLQMFRNLKARQLAGAIINLIFDLFSGEVKGRIGEYADISNLKYHSPILLSTEQSIVDIIKCNKDSMGQYSRFIEVPTSKGELTDSLQHSKELDKFYKNVGGYGAEAFVQFLLDNEMHGEALRKKYDEWYNKLIDGELGETTIGNRQASKVALILLSGELLNQCFKINLNLEKIEVTLKESIAEMIEKTKFSNDGYEKFCTYVKGNPEKFAPSVDRCYEEMHIGHYKPCNTMDSGHEVWILSSGLELIYKEEMIKGQGFSILKMLKIWKEQGKLISGSCDGRMTSKVNFYTIANKKEQKNVYIIKVKNFETK